MKRLSTRPLGILIALVASASASPCRPECRWLPPSSFGSIGFGTSGSGCEDAESSLFDVPGVYPDSIAASAGSWSFLVTHVDPDDPAPRLKVDGELWAIGELSSVDGDAAIVSFEYPEIPAPSTVTVEVNRGGALQGVTVHQTVRSISLSNQMTFITAPGILDLAPLSLDTSIYEYVGPPPGPANCHSAELLRLFNLLQVSSIYKMHPFCADGDSVWYSPGRDTLITVPAYNRHWYAARTSVLLPESAGLILSQSEDIVSASCIGAFHFMDLAMVGLSMVSIRTNGS